MFLRLQGDILNFLFSDGKQGNQGYQILCQRMVVPPYVVDRIRDQLISLKRT